MIDRKQRKEAAMPDTATATTSDVVAATTVQVASVQGTMTVYGAATLLLNGPADPEGRLRLTLRYESRSLWMWWNTHPDDEYQLDLWAPVPPITQDAGSLPWMRTTAYRMSITANYHDRSAGLFVTTGIADRAPKTGEVMRFRQDITSPSGESTPAEVPRR